jgi:hypothetical protein
LQLRSGKNIIIPCNTCFPFTPSSKTLFIRHPSLSSSFVKRLMDKRRSDHGQTCMLSSRVFKFHEYFTHDTHVWSAGSASVRVTC